MDTSWGTDNNVNTILEDLHVISNNGTTNTGVTLNIHEITDGNDDLLDLLCQLTGWSQNEGLALFDA